LAEKLYELLFGRFPFVSLLPLACSKKNMEKERLNNGLGLCKKIAETRKVSQVLEVAHTCATAMM